jgi:hypothetical protein
MPSNGGANCSGSTTKVEEVSRSCSVQEYADIRTSSATNIDEDSAKINGYIVDGDLSET